MTRGVKGPEGVGRAFDDQAERAIVEYLLEHPELFVRHPELLERLSIPHACGSAVSLIEYQVGVLKDQCRELRRRMRELVDNARSNEDLAQRLHRLTLSLIESPSLDEVFATLYQSLEQGFGADLVALRVYGNAIAPGDRGLGELAGTADPTQAHFVNVLESLRPVCGRLRHEQLEALFHDRAQEVASAALVPFAAGERRGVLGIASRESDRIQPNMGTLYLRQLADVIGRLLGPRVA